MHIRYAAPKGASKSVDLVGVGCFEGDKEFLTASSGVQPAARERINKTLATKKFSAKPGETFFVPLATPAAAAILLVGLGKRDRYKLETARRAAAKLLGQAKAFRYESLRITLDSFTHAFTTAEIAGAAVEGLRLSDYRFDKYKSKPAPALPVADVELVTDKVDNRAVKAAIAEAEAVCEGVIFTRNLANEPANFMTPPALAKAAKDMAAKNGLTCKVLGLPEIKRLGMGGVIGVSQGSDFPPQFIIVENKVKASSSRPIVLVGKGVTFDTGGISIKPANDMDKMRYDMSGAAAVLGTMLAVAKLKLPVRVIALAPVVENMPDAKAQRPGDIIKCLNGKTVEVLNTDAEGRLILADALAYAERYNPRAIVDIATLTGACAVTFHDLAIGLMSTDPELTRRLIEAGERTGERCWELPLWDEYFELIRGQYGDIQNISKKYAGTITAGMFLKEFASHTTAWAHLDVAGTAWADSPKPLAPVGSVGVGVRLMTELVKSYL